MRFSHSVIHLHLFTAHHTLLGRVPGIIHTETNHQSPFGEFFSFCISSRFFLQSFHSFFWKKRWEGREGLRLTKGCWRLLQKKKKTKAIFEQPTRTKHGDSSPPSQKSHRYEHKVHQDVNLCVSVDNGINRIPGRSFVPTRFVRLSKNGIQILSAAVLHRYQQRHYY